MISACSDSKVRYVATFEFDSDIKHINEIELLIKQRLSVKDSLDFVIKINENQCKIEFYDSLDTSLISLLLKNKIEDGIYSVLDIKTVKQTLWDLNNELKAPIINDLKKELQKMKENSQSLADEINITNMEEHIKKPPIEEAFPLYMKLDPSKLGVSKSIGLCNVDDLDSIYSFLEKSGCFPNGTIFLHSDIVHNIEYRYIHAINSLSKRPMNITLTELTEQEVIIFNNIVYASKIESNEKPIEWGILDTDIKNPNQILLLDSLISNGNYLQIDKITITPVNIL